MSGKVCLYEQDFVRWTEAQAAVLRRAAETKSNLPLDWTNLAEEVESLGRSQRRELRSRLAPCGAVALAIDLGAARHLHQPAVALDQADRLPLAAWALRIWGGPNWYISASDTTSRSRASSHFRSQSNNRTAMDSFGSTNPAALRRTASLA